MSDLNISIADGATPSFCSQQPWSDTPEPDVTGMGAVVFAQRKLRITKINGFTLIELMMVITIIGILVAIAIPQYSLYRSRSFNAAAQADLRNAATAQEAYFMDHATYSAVTTNLIGPTYMLFFSQGVHLAIVASSTDSSGYVMRAWHEKGDTTFSISGPGGTID